MRNPGICTVPFPEMGDGPYALYWNPNCDNPAVTLFADFVKGFPR